MPSFVSKFLFFVGFFFVKRVLGEFLKSDISVAIRNSYALDYYEPLFSDIDITLLTSSKQKNVIAKILQKLKAQKTWNRMIGEINVYYSEDLGQVLRCCNPLELRRDPFIASHGHVLNPPTLEEKIVFFAKMLEADHVALQVRPETRQKKWDYHSRQVFADGLQVRSPSVDHLLETVASHWQISDTGWKNSLREYFSRKNQLMTFPHAELEALLRENPWWWACFANKFCFLNLNVELSSLQWRCLLATLRWEIWGIYVQSADIEEGSLTLHSQNLTRFLSHLLTIPTLEEFLQRELKEILDVHEKLFARFRDPAQRPGF